jgi:hypothetical protein
MGEIEYRVSRRLMRILVDLSEITAHSIATVQSNGRLFLDEEVGIRILVEEFMTCSGDLLSMQIDGSSKKPSILRKSRYRVKYIMNIFSH